MKSNCLNMGCFCSPSSLPSSAQSERLWHRHWEHVWVLGCEYVTLIHPTKTNLEAWLLQHAVSLTCQHENINDSWVADLFIAWLQNAMPYDKEMSSYLTVCLFFLVGWWPLFTVVGYWFVYRSARRYVSSWMMLWCMKLWSNYVMYRVMI